MLLSFATHLNVKGNIDCMKHVFIVSIDLVKKSKSVRQEIPNAQSLNCMKPSIRYPSLVPIRPRYAFKVCM
jgi:hypothetical protein